MKPLVLQNHVVFLYARYSPQKGLGLSRSYFMATPPSSNISRRILEAIRRNATVSWTCKRGNTRDEGPLCRYRLTTGI